jgi:hypothetical protein
VLGLAAAVRVAPAAEEQCPDYAVANARAPSSGSGTGVLHLGWVRLAAVEASRSSWDAAAPTSSQTAFADPAVAAEDPQDQEPHLAAVVVGRRGVHPSPQSSLESEACLVGAAAAAAEVVGHPCPGSCRRQRHSSSGH